MDIRKTTRKSRVTRKPEKLPGTAGHSRRTFLELLGAGLLVCVSFQVPARQSSGGRGRNRTARVVSARIHLGADGSLTVLTGKVEGGQGARAELTQAAAEELRVAPERITLIMADTATVPDDGITAGSRSTPSTVPAIRQAAATVRQLLVDHAAKSWSVNPGSIRVTDGVARQGSGERALKYADLAGGASDQAVLDVPISENVTLTPVSEYKVLGTSFRRPNARDIVTGAHQYPSDIRRPGMLYGKVLRAPALGARLISIDLEPAKAMKGVVAVREEDFVGVAAPTTFEAREAMQAIEKTAKWDRADFISDGELYDYLRKNARGGVPANPFAAETASANQVLKQSFRVPYVQHAPLEPRAAVAEWAEGNLTVWTGTQNPFGCRSELMRTFSLPESKVRVIVPDFGGGFGGKHTGETGVEASRLARAAGRPVSLRWTREEEFKWAAYRPAALIEIEAGLTAEGAIDSWHFVNINSGGAAVDTPYRIARAQSRFVPSNSPLRPASYRALASTANNFARECFMDELAAAAKRDPLEFRLGHLENGRLRAVLEEAARRFRWKERRAAKPANSGVGLACGTEKGSFVAACVEVRLGADGRTFEVTQVCEVFECGKILNPENLLAQVQGAIIMGLGPALREEMLFDKGVISNASFRRYRVPRFADVPPLDLHLLDRPDLPSVGGGETPIIAIAPAIANAVHDATGKWARQLPVRLENLV